MLNFTPYISKSFCGIYILLLLLCHASLFEFQAQACKDLKTPFTKYPKGFYVEIKYDGERVQIHKQGNIFNYYSRSLKPVMQHKVFY